MCYYLNVHFQGQRVKRKRGYVPSQTGIETKSSDAELGNPSYLKSQNYNVLVLYTKCSILAGVSAAERATSSLPAQEPCRPLYVQQSRDNNVRIRPSTQIIIIK